MFFLIKSKCSNGLHHLMFHPINLKSSWLMRLFLLVPTVGLIDLIGLIDLSI